MGTSFTPELIRLLTASGCRFERHGKGDHDIWYLPHYASEISSGQQNQIQAHSQCSVKASRFEKSVLRAYFSRAVFIYLIADCSLNSALIGQAHRQLALFQSSEHKAGFAVANAWNFVESFPQKTFVTAGVFNRHANEIVIVA